VREAEAAGELDAVDPEVVGEIGLRLGASFVLMPDSVLPLHDEAATHATVKALLAPVLAPA
jgi:hypothetical protein